MMTKQFQAGTTYTARSACDYDTVFSYRVVSRTAKQLTIERLNRGDTVKRGVYVWNGVESCKPDGTYSMCPVINADRTA